MTNIHNNEISRLLNELQLTQARAGDFLGVNPRSVRRWVDEDTEPPLAVLRLFRLMKISGISRYEAEYLTNSDLSLTRPINPDGSFVEQKSGEN
jgi:hypothetical protein